MKRVLGVLLLTAGLCAARWNREAEPEAAAEPVVEPLPQSGPLWGHDLPMDPGVLPQGLANPTAQACAACHDTGWEGSAHATPSSSWRQAAAANGNSPLCTACHLPLQSQHAQVVVEYNGGPLGDAEVVPNPGYDSALAGESVTCAACHMRDGALVGPEASEAPHPTAQGGSDTCTACHQYTWPGGDSPLYDTVGEWSTSAWAAEDVGCTDCHGHDLRARGALSLLLDAPAELTRGEPVNLTLTVQNTGAGHNVPTGSPWGALLIEVQVVADGGPVGEAWTTRLGKTLGEDAPWPLVEDSTLAPLAERLYEVPLELPQSAPDGRGDVVVRTLRIGPDGVATPSQVTRVPVVVY